MGAGATGEAVCARRPNRVSAAPANVMPLQTKNIANQREYFILPGSQRLHAKVRANVTAVLLYRVTYGFPGSTIAIRMVVQGGEE